MTLLAEASPLTAVSYMACTQPESCYIRSVLTTAKRSCQQNVVNESTLCVCERVFLYVCVHLLCPSYVVGGGAGWGTAVGVCLASGCQRASSITDTAQLGHT